MLRDGTQTSTKFEARRIAKLCPGCKMVVTEGTGIAKPRRITSLLNLSGGVEFGVHHNNLRNVERGIIERVFLNSEGVPPPRCCEDSINKLNEVKRFVKRSAAKTAKLTEEEFLSYYTGRRHATYARAVESLVYSPLTVEDAGIKTFVKPEKINMTTKGDPAPRVIQPRSPRYNVELGMYLKHLEPRLYKIVKKLFGGHTIFKGMNALDSGKNLHRMWEKYRDPVAIGLDASRFDQHVRAELLKFEHSLYMMFYPGDKWLAELLSWQLVNRCVAYTADGSVKYVVDGSRMSGDMNTALGNCLIMCTLVYSLMAERGMVGRFSLANNGDDCVLIMERGDLARATSGLAAWFLEFGLVMKVEDPVTEFEHIDFCQTSPVWTPEGYIMVRNPHNGLDKDITSFDNITCEAQWRQSCRLIGECGLHLAGHIPLYNALYRKLYTIGRDSKKLEPQVCGMWWLARGLDNSRAPVHPRTRASFALAFGYPPDLQEAIETDIGKISESYEPNRDGYYNIINNNEYRDRKP